MLNATEDKKQAPRGASLGAHPGSPGSFLPAQAGHEGHLRGAGAAGTYSKGPVLLSAGIESIVFLVAGTVLCFGFRVRRLLITHDGLVVAKERFS